MKGHHQEKQFYVCFLKRFISIISSFSQVMWRILPLISVFKPRKLRYGHMLNQRTTKFPVKYSQLFWGFQMNLEQNESHHTQNLYLFYFEMDKI